MCIPDKALKLCTCGKVDRSKPWWELIRKNSEDQRIVTIGMIEAPSERHWNTLNELVSQINIAEFDFEYSPQEGDILNVELPKEIDIGNAKRLNLKYSFEGKWQPAYSEFSSRYNKYKLIRKGDFEGMDLDEITDANSDLGA